MGWALWAFWWIRGHHGEGRRWMEAVLQSDLSPALRAKALIVAGSLAVSHGDREQCERYCGESLGLSRQVGNKVLAAWATMSCTWSNLERNRVQRVWLQAALAAGAGLGSLAVCSGAVVAIVLLLIASMTFGAGGPLSSDPALFWVGVVTVLLFAWASLSLSPLALGARGGTRSEKPHCSRASVSVGLCLSLSCP